MYDETLKNILNVWSCKQLFQYVRRNRGSRATYLAKSRDFCIDYTKRDSTFIFLYFFLFLFSFMKIVIRGYHSFHRFHSPLWFEQFFIRMLMQKSISIPTITNSVYINYSILNNLISRIINIFQITYHLSIPFSRILTNWKIVFANFWWNNDKKKISSSFYIIVHSYSLYNS